MDYFGKFQIIIIIFCKVVFVDTDGTAFSMSPRLLRECRP